MNCIKCKDKELAAPNQRGTVYLRCAECDRPLNKVIGDPEQEAREVAEDNKRTIQQNKRLHQWMRELAEEFNNRGLYVQQILKPTWEIEWTEQLVKDNIIRPIAEAIAKTEHTSELNKQQLQKVLDIVDKNLLQKWQINIPFSDEE